jgi:hypothetical protein
MGDCLMKKNEGRKSRDIVPLFGLDFIHLSIWWIFLRLYLTQSVGMFIHFLLLTIDCRRERLK